MVWAEAEALQKQASRRTTSIILFLIAVCLSGATFFLLFYGRKIVPIEEDPTPVATDDGTTFVVNDRIEYTPTTIELIGTPSVPDVQDVSGSLFDGLTQYDPSTSSFPGATTLAGSLRYPLKNPPQGRGFIAMSPGAMEYVTNLENGFVSLMQYAYKVDQETGNERFFPNTALTVQTGGCTPSAPQASMHTLATSVGSVGYRSVAYSLDGDRLYVAYHQHVSGEDIVSSTDLPFRQRRGRVCVFSRPEPLDQTDASLLSHASEWQYVCELSVQNPYGYMAAGLEQAQYTDPRTDRLSDSDYFGHTIATSWDPVRAERIVAIGSFRGAGTRSGDGGHVAVYHEQNSAHRVMSILRLNGELLVELNTAHTVGLGTSPYGETATNIGFAFGTTFDVSANSVAVSIRRAANDAPNLVCMFERTAVEYDDARLAQPKYEYVYSVVSPNNTEDFGASVLLSPDGRAMIVGSPARPNETTQTVTGGGSVYLYARNDTNGVWTLRDTFTTQGADVDGTGARGYFVNADRMRQVIAVSTNQNNLVRNPPEPVATNVPEVDEQRITFLTVDYDKFKFIVPDPDIYISQFDSASNTQYADPTFGALVGVEVHAATRTVRVVVGEPMNTITCAYTLSYE